jgi:hypothetical protein
MANTTIKAHILGGSGEGAAMAIASYDALLEFIAEGGNYSRESPGAPIAYKLAHLADNAPARMSLAEEYETKECVDTGQEVREVEITLHRLVVEVENDFGDELEIYGDVTIDSYDDIELYDHESLFHRSENEYIPISIATPFPPSGSVATKKVRAVLGAGTSSSIVFRVALWDENSPVVDTELNSSELVWFTDGWTKPVTIRASGLGSIVRLDFDMKLLDAP